MPLKVSNCLDLRRRSEVVEPMESEEEWIDILIDQPRFLSCAFDTESSNGGRERERGKRACVGVSVVFFLPGF
jgi:hypothetical protein